MRRENRQPELLAWKVWQSVTHAKDGGKRYIFMLSMLTCWTLLVKRDWWGNWGIGRWGSCSRCVNDGLCCRPAIPSSFRFGSVSHATCMFSIYVSARYFFLPTHTHIWLMIAIPSPLNVSPISFHINKKTKNKAKTCIIIVIINWDIFFFFSCCVPRLWMQICRYLSTV